MAVLPHSYQGPLLPGRTATNKGNRHLHGFSPLVSLGGFGIMVPLPSKSGFYGCQLTMVKIPTMVFYSELGNFLCRTRNHRWDRWCWWENLRETRVFTNKYTDFLSIFSSTSSEMMQIAIEITQAHVLRNQECSCDLPRFSDISSAGFTSVTDDIMISRKTYAKPYLIVKMSQML